MHWLKAFLPPLLLSGLDKSIHPCCQVYDTIRTIRELIGNQLIFDVTRKAQQESIALALDILIGLTSLECIKITKIIWQGMSGKQRSLYLTSQVKAAKQNGVTLMMGWIGKYLTWGNRMYKWGQNVQIVTDESWIHPEESWRNLGSILN